MSSQLEHHTTTFNQNKFPIVLVCDGVQSPANIGSLFRICDALGIEKIIFCNSEINLRSTRLTRTSRSTHKIVDFKVAENCLNEINTLEDKGYKLIALEITENSIPVEEYLCNNEDKIALIIGNEQSGISEEILTRNLEAVHINMYGNNSSMNVVQATSITLYNLINKLK